MWERPALAREEGMLGAGEGGELRLMGRQRRVAAVEEARRAAAAAAEAGARAEETMSGTGAGAEGGEALG